MICMRCFAAKGKTTARAEQVKRKAKSQRQETARKQRYAPTPPAARVGSSCRWSQASARSAKGYDIAFQIFNDGYVTTDSGTGIVHLAPDFGEDDNRVMKSEGLYFNACPVDDKGHFTKPVTDYEGTMVKDADKQIIKDLKESGKLYDQGVIVHSYPHCPRSNTPLIYRSIPQWYVKVETIKDKIIAANIAIEESFIAPIGIVFSRSEEIHFLEIHKKAVKIKTKNTYFLHHFSLVVE